MKLSLKKISIFSASWLVIVGLSSSTIFASSSEEDERQKKATASQTITIPLSTELDLTYPFGQGASSGSSSGSSSASSLLSMSSSSLIEKIHQKAPSIFDLPHDALLTIFDLLSKTNVLQLSHTCRTGSNSVISIPEFYLTARFRNPYSSSWLSPDWELFQKDPYTAKFKDFKIDRKGRQIPLKILVEKAPLTKILQLEEAFIDDDLSELVKLKDNLFHLDLRWASGTAFDNLTADIFGQLRNLKYLNLAASARYSTDLSEFSKLEQLEFLSLKGCHLTTNFSFLSSLINLTELDLEETRADSLAGLGRLKKLKSLSLKYALLNYFDDALSGLSSLTSLNLSNTCGVDFHRARLPNLTTLNLTDAVNIRGIGTLLSALLSLRELCLFKSTILVAGDISSITSASDPAFDLDLSILKTFPSFREASIHGAKGLKMVSIATLKEEASSVKSLRRSILEEMRRGGGNREELLTSLREAQFRPYIDLSGDPDPVTTDLTEARRQMFTLWQKLREVADRLNIPPVIAKIMVEYTS